MLSNLRAKSKLKFVLGTCERSNYGGVLEEELIKCSAFVLALIMNIVSKELLSGIVYTTNVVAVRVDLKEQFDKIDGSRGYRLQREICTVHQGNLTIYVYFLRYTFCGMKLMLLFHLLYASVINLEPM